MRIVTIVGCFVFAAIVCCSTVVSGSDTNPDSSWIETFFKENAEKPDVVVRPSGLQYKIIRKGMGLYHPTANTMCKCHYVGKYLNGTQFDSSLESRGHDRPVGVVPSHTKLKGMTEALQLMVEGDKWELYLPSELAYGEEGSHGSAVAGGVAKARWVVGPNEALVYTVELEEITGSDRREADDRCDVVTLSGCDERVSDYVQKSLRRYGRDTERLRVEWRRLDHIDHEAVATQEMRNWVHTRMAVLEQLIAKMESGEIKPRTGASDEL